MRAFLAGLGLLWVSYGPGLAQHVAEGVDTESAAGRIEIVEAGDGFSRVVSVGGRHFFADGLYRFVSVEDQRGALYLISLGSGGSGCPALYAWLHTEGGRARVTETFGNCSDLAELRSDKETVRVVMPARVAADGFVAFVYDGRSIEEVVLGQVSAGVGLRAEDWIGRYPYEVMRDADWRGPLVAQMGEAAYRRAGEVIGTSTPFVVEGDWVVGEGFNNRLPGIARGVLALNRTDGRAIVAIRTQAHGLEVWVGACRATGAYWGRIGVLPGRETRHKGSMMDIKDIEALFTRADGSYLCARWGRPIVPVVFGVEDESIGVLKGAFEAVCALAGHQMAETDPELGVNVMVFFCRDWAELAGVRDLDRLVPELRDLIGRLQEAEASQYRIFRFDAAGTIRASFIFLRMDAQLADVPADALALAGDKAVLRPEIAAVIRAAYDPVMPPVAQDASHALRLAARLQMGEMQ